MKTLSLALLLTTGLQTIAPVQSRAMSVGEIAMTLGYSAGAFPQIPPRYPPGYDPRLSRPQKDPALTPPRKAIYPKR